MPTGAVRTGGDIWESSQEGTPPPLENESPLVVSEGEVPPC